MNSAAEITAGGGGADGGNAVAAVAPPPSVVVVERVVTVEYLEPSMSRGLLGKFPDSSAFGFDYSQSGIWSPLGKLPRSAPTPTPTPAPLASGEGSADFLIARPKRRARAGAGGSRLRARAGAGGRSSWRRRRVPRRDASFLDAQEKSMGGGTRLDFSPPPPSPAKAGWRRVLKAAIRKFKARQRLSRPAPLVQMILPML